MKLLNPSYPGNGQLPKVNFPVFIQVCSRDGLFTKTIGQAYWSGSKWVCKKPFKIGYGKVVAWSTQVHDGDKL